MEAAFMRNIIASCLILGACACSSTTTSTTPSSIDVVQSPQTFTHGTCAAITLGYQTGSLSQNDVKASAAPNAESLTFQVTNGQAYADSACATPITGAYTFPAGAATIQVGFKPTQAGAFDFKYTDASGEAGFSGNAT
jgi:hypothetical protein